MKHLLLIIIAGLVLPACSLPFLSREQAALQVNASPQSTVFLNGNHVGQTPFYDDNLKPGEYTVKIQLDSNPSETWETRVTLNPQVVTVVNRAFGTTPDLSSNYLIQMESLTDESTSEVSVVTIPDNVIVKLDGQPEGFSPLSLKDISPGSHSLSLSAPGYAEQIINIQIEPGFKMILSATLARAESLPEPETNLEASPSADLTPAVDEENEEADIKVTPSPTPKADDEEEVEGASGDLKRPYVEIIETGTGWLRVRSEPNAYQDNEVARVDVGEQFPFIEANDTGWYQIEYEPGEEGWISGKYADLFE